jgi:phage baseplate assembly protein V
MLKDRNLYQDMAEAERGLENLAVLGQVVALDAPRARVKVKAGPMTTGWLPWLAPKAGPDRAWHAPEPGEQVLVIAPGGDLEHGVVVGSIYRQAYPPPAASADITRALWQDGAVMEYDRAQHRWRLSVPPGGQIVLEIGRTRLELTDEGARLSSPRIDLN